MLVDFFLEQYAAFVQILDDDRIGVFDEFSGIVGDFGRKGAIRQHSLYYRQTILQAHGIVVCAKGRRHVDDTGAVFE